MKQAFEITPFGFLSNSKIRSPTFSCGSINARMFSHYVDTSEGSGEVRDSMLNSNDKSIRKQFEFEMSKVHSMSCIDPSIQLPGYSKNSNAEKEFPMKDIIQNKQKRRDDDIDTSNSNLSLLSNANDSWAKELYWKNLLKTPELTDRDIGVLDDDDDPTFNLNGDENDMNFFNLNWDSPLQSAFKNQHIHDKTNEIISLNNSQPVKSDFLSIISNPQSGNRIKIRLVKSTKQETETRYDSNKFTSFSDHSCYVGNMVRSNQKSDEELMEPSRKKIRIVESRKQLRCVATSKNKNSFSLKYHMMDAFSIANPSKMNKLSDLDDGFSNHFGENQSLIESREVEAEIRPSKVQYTNKVVVSNSRSAGRCRTELRMLF